MDTCFSKFMIFVHKSSVLIYRIPLSVLLSAELSVVLANKLWNVQRRNKGANWRKRVVEVVILAKACREGGRKCNALK
jgi:hypothetical protein